MYEFSYLKVTSTNQHEKLVMLDDPGCSSSHITSVACQIQRFDFDCNLAVARKIILITRMHPALGLKPLYVYVL
jgi:hypothetical protein